MNPRVFADYLHGKGWKLFPRKREDILVFQLEEKDDFHQITIPMDRNLSDYGDAIYRAMKIVAEVESRSVEEIAGCLSDLSCAKI